MYVFTYDSEDKYLAFRIKEMYVCVYVCMCIDEFMCVCSHMHENICTG